MNMLRTNLKKHQNLLKTIIIILVLGFIISFLLYNKMDNSKIINEIKNIEEYLNSNNINFIIPHLLSISILITCSITVIGLVIFPIYLLFEIVSIFYNLFIFCAAFKLKGFIFSIFYLILTKLIYLILLFIIFQKLYTIIKYLITSYTNKNNSETKFIIIKNLKKIIICLLGLFINDLLIYFFANDILLKLTFLIK